MDAETKAAIQEIVSTGLAGLKVDIEQHIATVVGASESKIELRIKGVETAGKGGESAGGSGGGGAGGQSSELEATVAELQQQLAQRDLDALRSDALAQYTKAALSVGAVAPGTIAELLLNRSKADDYNKTASGVLTLGSRPIETVVKDFLNSDEGATFRPTKDVEVPTKSANDKPSDGTGNDATTKVALDKAWDGFTKSFA